MTMKAAVLHKGERHLRIEEAQKPEPGIGEVRVRVKSCGVCGSDVHATVHPIMSLKHYPRIMGHESSGVVDLPGPGVSRFVGGERVVIGAGTSCGTCQECLAGRDNACSEVGVLGFDREGAYAEFIVVPERYLHILPDSIPFAEGAILADAVSTPYHALRYSGRMEQGETVAVIGCGGLGIHAVALAKALGAGKIVAVDIDSGALQHAGDFGADEIVDARQAKNIGKAIKEAGGGIDVVLDFSGRPDNISDSLRALNARGRVVMVGIGRGKLEVAMPTLMIYRQLCICGSYGCERGAVPELIELVESGRLDLSRSITSIHPLDQVNDCLEDLHARRGNPIRFVVSPEQ